MIKLLTDREVAAMLDMHKATVWRLAKIGVIPKPKHLGLKKSRWLKTEIDEYLARVIAA